MLLRFAFKFTLRRYSWGELLLLLRTVEDPNQLFLTGDTAQTIARGLSFRFQVGRCRLRVSKPVLKAPKVSALETIIW